MDPLSVLREFSVAKQLDQVEVDDTRVRCCSLLVLLHERRLPAGPQRAENLDTSRACLHFPFPRKHDLHDASRRAAR